MHSSKAILKILQEEIQNDDVIAFDHHPIAYNVIDTLVRNNIKISVITFSTDIIQYVSKYTNFNIIIPSATVCSTFHVLVGESVQDTFKKYNIKQYFISAPYYVENQLFQTFHAVAPIQQTLIKNAQRIYVMNQPDLSLPININYYCLGTF